MIPPEDSSSLQDRLRVVAEAVNVRRTPSLGGRIIGQLQKDDIVRGGDVSPDGVWQQVRNGELVGWSAGGTWSGGFGSGGDRHRPDSSDCLHLSHSKLSLEKPKCRAARLH